MTIIIYVAITSVNAIILKFEFYELRTKEKKKKKRCFLIKCSREVLVVMSRDSLVELTIFLLCRQVILPICFYDLSSRTNEQM